MRLADQPPDPATLARFRALGGDRRWASRLAELTRRAALGSLAGRAAQQRHALELALERLADPAAVNRAGRAERLLAAFAADAVDLAEALPPTALPRLRARFDAALDGEGTLVPLLHLMRAAALHRARGFEVVHSGLVAGTPWDLAVTRDGVTAEIACETVSAEAGRQVQRGDWCALVDRINPELQTWLAAHPGRYLLKMTLPEGMAKDTDIALLHRSISALLMAQKREDASAHAVLKLDPLILAGAQEASRLPARLRAQFGEEAHLAVTAAPGSGSVFVMAARAGRENRIAGATAQRLAQAAVARLSGDCPGILSIFLEDLDRAEWRSLRERMELEGATRRWLARPEARGVAAVTFASRMEMLGLAPPDAAPEGELRFRNPAHPEARSPALAPAILSSN